VPRLEILAHVVLWRMRLHEGYWAVIGAMFQPAVPGISLEMATRIGRVYWGQIMDLDNARVNAGPAPGSDESQWIGMINYVPV